MTLGETLIEVWRQALVEGNSRIELVGKSYPVTVTRAKRLRTARFDYPPCHIDGIEQNPESGSRWALLTREEKRVVQFGCERRYIGNVSEGELVRYPPWHSMGLAE